MILRAVVLLVISGSVPAAAGGSAEELPAELERRLQVLEALSNSRPRVCDRLVELSHAVPPSAVLSRLKFHRNLLELSLSKGTADDAKAILQPLVTMELCIKPATSSEGSPVTASCVVEDDGPNDLTLAAPVARPLRPGELASLRQRQDQARVKVPDLAELNVVDANLKDLAWKGLVKDWAYDIGRAVRGDALDSHELTGSGSTSFANVAEMLCALEHGGRSIGIDSFELIQPRPRNGEWVVDFSFTATTWRYRKEDEQKELRVTFREAHEPKWAPGTKPRSLATGRSPFGPPGVIFAGSSLELTGKECRKEALVAPSETEEFLGRELDEFAVAFVAPKGPQTCAMLVDAKGKCHELRRNTSFGPLGGKVTQIDEDAVTVTRFANDSSRGDGRPVAVKVALKVASKAAPPAWFCRQK